MSFNLETKFLLKKSEKICFRVSCKKNQQSCPSFEIWLAGSHYSIGLVTGGGGQNCFKKPSQFTTFYQFERPGSPPLSFFTYTLLIFSFHFLFSYFLYFAFQLKSTHIFSSLIFLLFSSAMSLSFYCHFFI